MKRPRLVVVFTASLALVGCQTNPSQPATDDQKRTQAEATILGAILGGVIGGLSTRDTEGAVTGAIAGGLAGYATGVHLSRLKQERIAREASLDEHIRHTEEVTMLARQYNDQLAREIAQLDSETKRVRARYRRTRANQAELAAKRDKVHRQKVNAERAYVALNDEYREKIQVLKEKKRAGSDPGELAELRGKVRTLKVAINELDEQNRQIAAMERRIP